MDRKKLPCHQRNKNGKPSSHKKAVSRKLSNMHFDFEVPLAYRDKSVEMIFAIEEGEVEMQTLLKETDSRTELYIQCPLSSLLVSSSSVLNIPGDNKTFDFYPPSSKNIDKWTQPNSSRNDTSEEKMFMNIIQKLHLARLHLKPIIEEIIKQARALTQTDVKKLQQNDIPICTLSLQQFSGAIKASKLLKEVNDDLCNKKTQMSKIIQDIPNMPYTNFIVNTLYFPNGNIDDEPINFKENIYIDKKLMQQLMELHKLLGDTIEKVKLKELQQLALTKPNSQSEQISLSCAENPQSNFSIDNKAYYDVDYKNIAKEQESKETGKESQKRFHGSSEISVISTKREVRDGSLQSVAKTISHETVMEKADSSKSSVISKSTVQGNNMSVTTNKINDILPEVNQTFSKESNITIDFKFQNIEDEMKSFKGSVEETLGAQKSINTIYKSKSTSSLDVKKSIKIADIAAAKQCILECLAELVEVHQYLLNTDKKEEIDFSSQIQLSGAPADKECCSRQNIPHLHAKLNGIPIVLKLNKETMDAILSTVKSYPRFPSETPEALSKIPVSQQSISSKQTKNKSTTSAKSHDQSIKSKNYISNTQSVFSKKNEAPIIHSPSNESKSSDGHLNEIINNHIVNELSKLQIDQVSIISKETEIKEKTLSNRTAPQKNVDLNSCFGMCSPTKTNNICVGVDRNCPKSKKSIMSTNDEYIESHESETDNITSADAKKDFKVSTESNVNEATLDVIPENYNDLGKVLFHSDHNYREDSTSNVITEEPVCLTASRITNDQNEITISLTVEPYFGEIEDDDSSTFYFKRERSVSTITTRKIDSLSDQSIASNKSDTYILEENNDQQNVPENSLKLPYNVSDSFMPPHSRVRHRVCSSLDFDPHSITTSLKTNGIVHPNKIIQKKLEAIGVDNIIEAHKPARCCRKSVLNETSQAELPYPASLLSLPLNDEDVDTITRTVTMYTEYKVENIPTHIYHAKMQYYNDLGKEDLWINFQKFSSYQVMYFEMAQQPSQRKKIVKATDKEEEQKSILLDQNWKSHYNNLKFFNKAKSKLKNDLQNNSHVKISLEKYIYDFLSEHTLDSSITSSSSKLNGVPYEPSLHSLPGVAYDPYHEFYAASEKSLPFEPVKKHIGVHVSLPSPSMSNSPVYKTQKNGLIQQENDDTSLSPENYANQFKRHKTNKTIEHCKCSSVKDCSTKSVQTTVGHKSYACKRLIACYCPEELFDESTQTPNTLKSSKSSKNNGNTSPTASIKSIKSDAREKSVNTTVSSIKQIVSTMLNDSRRSFSETSNNSRSISSTKQIASKTASDSTLLSLQMLKENHSVTPMKQTISKIINDNNHPTTEIIKENGNESSMKKIILKMVNNSTCPSEEIMEKNQSSASLKQFVSKVVSDTADLPSDILKKNRSVSSMKQADLKRLNNGIRSPSDMTEERRSLSSMKHIVSKMVSNSTCFPQEMLKENRFPKTSNFVGSCGKNGNSSKMSQAFNVSHNIMLNQGSFSLSDSISTTQSRDPNLETRQEMCWALTRVNIYDDGSREFEVLELSPIPPGPLIFPEINNNHDVLIGDQNYCKGNN